PDTYIRPGTTRRDPQTGEVARWSGNKNGWQTVEGGEGGGGRSRGGRGRSGGGGGGGQGRGGKQKNVLQTLGEGLMKMGRSPPRAPCLRVRPLRKVKTHGWRSSSRYCPWRMILPCHGGAPLHCRPLLVRSDGSRN